MKKSYFLTISLLILLVIPSVAQNYKTEWYFGAGGNFNSTWIIRQSTYGEPELKYKFTPSYAGNVNLGLDFSNYWGFKMELGYALLGQKYDDLQYDQPTTRTIKLSYFLLPVMFKYRVGGEKAKFYVMAGPQFGILLSANQEYKRNGVDAPAFSNPEVGLIDVSKKDIKERYTHAAFFMRLDVGVELTPSKHFMIDIGITSAYSVTDLNDDSWRFHDFSGGYQISHNFYAGLNLGINYRF
jgi:hypothetical protein